MINPAHFATDIVPKDNTPYEHDACVFDEFGLAMLRCHRCGLQVGGRTYVTLPSRNEIDKSVDVLAFSLHANYCQKEIKLSDGSTVNVHHCTDCVNHPVDLDRVSNQLKRAWVKEMIHAGRSHEKLEEYHNKFKDTKAIEDKNKTHIPWKWKENYNGGR